MAKRVGLALGSGGARGLAHIGVLKAFIENEIHIDYIAGSSAGAFVGAYYALYEEIKELEKEALKLSKRRILRLLDVTYPKHSLIKGKKIKKLIRTVIKNKTFRDTKIPLRLVATNLENGDEVILREGKIIDALEASYSVPGIFPAVKYKKMKLVDGGLIHPTPVDVVKKMGANVIIGVDITTRNKIKLKKPTLSETLMRSFEILRAKNDELNLSKVKNAIIIHPNFKDKKDALKFHNAKKFIKIGYKAAMKAMPMIKRRIGMKN